MIKDVEYLAAFEREYTASQPNDLEKNLELFEAMWQEAKALGVIPLKDPLEGIVGGYPHRQNPEPSILIHVQTTHRLNRPKICRT
jgi:hypothetical protein